MQEWSRKKQSKIVLTWTFEQLI